MGGTFPSASAFRLRPARGMGVLAGLGIALGVGPAAPGVATAQTGPVIEFAHPPDCAPPPLRGRSPGKGANACWTSACSFRHPACVHAPAATPYSFLLATLASADRAWDVLTGALGLPPPDTDLDGIWHVYLADDVLGGGRALVDGLDPRAHFDRASSFGLIDRRTAPGCELDLATARALARAALAGVAPATDEGSARAETESLARLAVPCGDTARDDLEFQSHPERTLVDPRSDPFDRGAALFFDWLDSKFAREPGGLLRGLWALAPTHAIAGQWRFGATPTTFDVLRATLKGALSTDSTLDDIFVRFAVERARATPSVRLSWRLPWPAHARRLASSEPVAPTGASYVMVDGAGVPAGAKLRIEAEWEDYGRMRWVVVKLDAEGRTMAEMPITSLDRGTRASLTVESLDGAEHVLIVGTNVGGTELPFDPDQGEWEPHGWLLTVWGIDGP